MIVFVELFIHHVRAVFFQCGGGPTECFGSSAQLVLLAGFVKEEGSMPDRLEVPPKPYNTKFIIASSLGWLRYSNVYCAVCARR